MVTWIKVVLLALSGVGYGLYFHRKYKIDVYFLPVYTLSVWFLALFVGGILNCLGQMAWLLYLLGFFLLWQEARGKKVEVRKIPMEYGFFLLGLLVTGILVRGKTFTQIDNFTHWATVVKNMLSTDRFPSFQDPAITFSSYPLGTAALLYYVCRMTSQTEPMQMWTQAFFVLSALLPLFSCCKKNRAIYGSLVAAMAGFLLCYNVPMTELLVDTLMPLAGMATALFIFVSFRGGQMSPLRGIPLLIWTMNIKHAAMIYVVFALMLFCVLAWKTGTDKKQILVTVGAVLLAKMLWSWHCDYVFVGAELSKHSLSSSWFRMILGEKTRGTIVLTIKTVLSALFTRPAYLWLLGWILLLGILVWTWVKEEKKRFLAFLCTGIALYGVYAAGVLGMYVFSMPEYELMASFGRYMRSMDIAMYYMLMVFAGMVVSKLDGKQAKATVAVGVVLTCSGWYWQTGTYAEETFLCCEAEEREKFEAPMAEGIEKRKSYLLCIENCYADWYPFTKYVWIYQMETLSVDQIIVTEEEDLDASENYDYVVILDPDNPVIEAWVAENYPDQAGKQVIQCFR